MKKTLLVLILSLPLWGLGGCNKDDDKPTDPVDLLPPITQTGAGTFGALVDSKPFIADNPWFNCYYQFVDGGYYFGIQGYDEVNSLVAIGIGTIKKEIFEGETYFLKEEINDSAYGIGGFYTENSFQYSITNQEYNGKLTILKLDFTNYIISGTFWFDLKNPFTGETVEIREGRFDTHFTQ